MKKILSNVLIITLLILSAFGCENTSPKKTITADTPYYSVTTGSFERDRNAYMSLDIKIPKITYSNNEGSELIDSLNTEIESNLNKLIAEAKTRAQETYETYLKSAKDNVKKDIDNKISELETKYKSVLGKEEKEILSKLNADDIVNYSFSNMGRMNTFSNLIASYSNAIASYSNAAPRMGRGFFGGGMPRQEYFDTVKGYTSSEEIINPALHNKKIIVVETTAAPELETTISIKGRPGMMPSEESSRSFNKEFPPSDRASRSNAKPPRFATKSEANQKIQKQETDQTMPKQDFVKKVVVPEEKTTKVSTPSKVSSSEEITLENFYRDLRRIRRFNLPDDFSLTIQYIPTTIECHYEVKCLDEDYLSLFVELSESRTTSTVKRLFYNVDLNNKKMISLKDILGDKYKETSIKCINEAIEKWNDEQKATLREGYSVDNYITENTPFFINNNHKPVIEIEKFVITIGSTGYHEFQIS